jgi:hypothetical protein
MYKNSDPPLQGKNDIKIRPLNLRKIGRFRVSDDFTGKHLVD